MTEEISEETLLKLKPAENSQPRRVGAIFCLFAPTRSQLPIKAHSGGQISAQTITFPPGSALCYSWTL